MMKLRRMKWEEHIPLTAEIRNACKIFVGRSHFKYLGLFVVTILKWMTKEMAGNCYQNRDQWRCVINTRLNHPIPQRTENSLTVRTTPNYQKQTVLHVILGRFSTIQFTLFCLPVFSLKMWRIAIIIIIKPLYKTIISLPTRFQVVCRT